MLIDWFTVIAQIVNFLVLVGLLKYFLFDRITKAMDEREQTIAAALEKAEEGRKLAEEEADRYRRMRCELEEDRRRILDQARTDADALRMELVQHARADVDRTKAGWEESLEREKSVFLADLRKHVGDQSLSIARSALRDLADRDLEERIIHTFKDRLHNMSAEDLEAMRYALQDSESEIVCRTAFEISEGDRDDIVKLFCSHFSEGLRVRFERSGIDACGIEMRFRGHKIGWSIDSFLDGLEKTISSTLQERLQSGDRRPSDSQAEGLRHLEQPQAPGAEKSGKNQIHSTDRTRDQE